MHTRMYRQVQAGMASHTHIHTHTLSATLQAARVRLENMPRILGNTLETRVRTQVNN